ncbi:catalase [Polaromonas sp. A23]|uniref:catalase n=1 Tax=Polaromonas sp. A23 TaxID=1944133 RepID=UPI0009842940|nr:catalase [Polaromonas sp. A23]OOG46369.1 catalase [Polaromonas sp. A23]
MSTQTPSTTWQERIADDEAARYEAYARRFAEIQRRKSARYGTGRTLHRKQLTAARGELRVLADLPEFARHGLFAAPASHEVLLRLSNGGLNKASDSMPDIRGFSFKVWGVSGDSALGGPAVSQDFTLINQEKFAFAGSAEFVDLVEAASYGNAALVKFFFKRYGFYRGPVQLAKMLKTAAKSFKGFTTESFFSSVPMACGPYAVRVRLLPASSNGPASADAQKDWGADFARRLATGALEYELQLQPFVNEKTTPIEDASVNWPTPYTTVALLTLPQQTASQALLEQAESNVFDPWQALAQHRPLGDVQRARKVVYFQSQQGRGASAKPLV